MVYGRSQRQIEGEWDKEDEENYACVKVVLGRTAYRSCVPKYGEIRLNCSSVLGRNVVCYCHTDDCNAAFNLINSPPALLLAFLAFLAIR